MGYKWEENAPVQDYYVYFQGDDDKEDGWEIMGEIDNEAHNGSKGLTISIRKKSTASHRENNFQYIVVSGNDVEEQKKTAEKIYEEHLKGINWDEVDLKATIDEIKKKLTLA